MMFGFIPTRRIHDFRQEQQGFDRFQDLRAVKYRQRRYIPRDIEIDRKLFGSAFAHDTLTQLWTSARHHGHFDLRIFFLKGLAKHRFEGLSHINDQRSFFLRRFNRFVPLRLPCWPRLGGEGKT